jgi:hypothetical protein
VQSNPGLIPLAIEQVFSIIESTPDREFLLRVSYIEVRTVLVMPQWLLLPSTQKKISRTRVAVTADLQRGDQ